jgi:hypothetical protein
MRFKWRKKTAWCTLWCVTAVIILAFAPVIFVFAWHATHSTKKEFAGYRFTVPRDFVPVPRNYLPSAPAAGGVAFVHGQTQLDSRFFHLSAIMIDQTGHRFDLSHWESTITRSAGQIGLVAPQTFRTTMGGMPAACYQEHVQSDWAMVCLSQDGIAMQYTGDFAHIPQARAMLEGAQKL